MWEIYLQQIREEKELYDEEINSGASEKEIYKLVTTAKEKWNMKIPQQYLDVLSRINGIEFNGFILYGVDQYLLEHEMKQLVYGLLEFNHMVLWAVLLLLMSSNKKEMKSRKQANAKGKGKRAVRRKGR